MRINVRYCYRRGPAPGDREAAALRVPASQAEAHELWSDGLLGPEMKTEMDPLRLLRLVFKTGVAV